MTNKKEIKMEEGFYEQIITTAVAKKIAGLNK